MKVLGHDGSPFVRKVRIVLEEKRIPYEYVHARPSVRGLARARAEPAREDTGPRQRATAKPSTTRR